MRRPHKINMDELTRLAYSLEDHSDFQRVEKDNFRRVFAPKRAEFKQKIQQWDTLTSDEKLNFLLDAVKLLYVNEMQGS